MIPVRRLSHAVFESADVPRQAEYYSRVMGLSVLSQTVKQAVMGGPAGQELIIFEAGSSNRCLRLAFQVDPAVDMAAIAACLKQADIRSEPRSDISPYISQALVFTDPKGTEIELFREHDLTPLPARTSGIAPLKLGHIAFSVPSAHNMSEFYAGVLGFRVSDWIEDKFVFMRCGPDHHTVNFLNGATTFMHHIAYELKDWAHVLTACEVLGREKRPIIWGPGRHRVGHNIFIYHRDPDDNIIEFDTELDLMKEEELGFWEPRPWHLTNPQRPAVWTLADASPIWGLPPSADFRRNGNDHLGPPR
jgi:catechol 2,3-dioxygenase-like lactoylglutathione lyase family enzyme